jgi:hypothetical protein
MGAEYVRGYASDSGTSHMVALWIGNDEPQSEDGPGWAWFRADKVLFVKCSEVEPTRTVVEFEGNAALITRASPQDVRWGIDLALCGGVHRTKPLVNYASQTTARAYDAAALAGFLAAEAEFRKSVDEQKLSEMGS